MSVQIAAARSAEEVGALRDVWLGLRPADVNADPDVFLALLRTDNDVLRPHVLFAEVDGAPRALLAARLVSTKLPVRVGYKQVYAPRVRALTIVQGGLVGDPDPHVVEALYAEARRVLAAGDAHVLRLRRLPEGSHLLRLARERSSRATRGEVGESSPRWQLQLPESLGAILQTQSSRTRANHRRYARRLEEDYGDRLSFVVHRQPEDVELVVRSCEQVSTLTYQQRLGGGFTGSPAERGLLELAAERGWLRAFVLSIDDEPKAFWIGNAYRGTFFTGPTGYDPALADLRLGTYVLMRMLESLCADEDVDVVDYGIGDAEYKRHFGTESRLEHDALVFAPTFQAVRINLMRSALTAAAGVAAAAGARLPGLRDVKRRWRKRLAAS